MWLSILATLVSPILASTDGDLTVRVKERYPSPEEPSSFLFYLSARSVANSVDAFLLYRVELNKLVASLEEHIDHITRLAGVTDTFDKRYPTLPISFNPLQKILVRREYDTYQVLLKTDSVSKAFFKEGLDLLFAASNVQKCRGFAPSHLQDFCAHIIALPEANTFLDAARYFFTLCLDFNRSFEGLMTKILALRAEDLLDSHRTKTDTLALIVSRAQWRQEMLAHLTHLRNLLERIDLSFAVARSTRFVAEATRTMPNL